MDSVNDEAMRSRRMKQVIEGGVKARMKYRNGRTEIQNRLSLACILRRGQHLFYNLRAWVETTQTNG